MELGLAWAYTQEHPTLYRHTQRYSFTLTIQVERQGASTMTQIERNLPRKPLVEAILEVRWDLDGKPDPAHPLFAGALAGIVASRYPTQERLPAADMPDEFTPHIVKFRMRPKQKPYPLIQAGPGVVTLNTAEEYSWDSYKISAMHLWDSLHEAYPPFNEGAAPRVKNVTLKYINGHPVGAREPQAFVQDELNTSISLPRGVTEYETDGSPNGIAVFASYPLRRGDTTGTVRIQNGLSAGIPTMLWELAAEGKFQIPIDRETFSEWLDYSHDVIEKWFFSLAAGKLLTEFRGEVRGRG
ncbi:hypothetical protein Asp14428_48650 [Actinoplanes sp. NBRC 14428]|nr:hypothetical protein Asp14428_48650 [Actinoplanes sp. NBRC 14428]